MKYIALILAGASSAVFLKGYVFAKELLAAHHPWEFQGGQGFALCAPLWGYSIVGWVLGLSAAFCWIGALILMKKKALRSLAVIATVPLMYPFTKASWTFVIMLVDTYWRN
jgi:glycerol-3-phosphate acyltransferase PlsY